MSDPLREPHERDGFLSSKPFPKETRQEQRPETRETLEGERRPPVLGVLLLFILIFWGGVAAFFLL